MRTKKSSEEVPLDGGPSITEATKPPRKPREIWPIKLQRQTENENESVSGKAEWTDVDHDEYATPKDAKASIQPGTVGTFRLIRVGPTFKVSKKIVESVLFE
jgi:hypothetical protein